MTRKIAVIGIILIMMLNIAMITDFAEGENTEVNSGFEWVNPLPTGNWLKSASWKPDGSYALITGGNGAILKYDGNDFCDMVSLPHYYFFDIAWEPNGKYALLVGRYTDPNGAGRRCAVAKYDGDDFVLIPPPTLLEFHTVAWKPGDDYALIAGSYGNLYRYDGISFQKIPTGTDRGLLAISWKIDGSHALIVGYNGTILKYDGSSVSKVSFNNDYLLTGVSWKPSENCALIVGYDGIVLEYYGISVEELHSESDMHIESISWDPNGNYALLVGGYWDTQSSFVIKYDGADFATLQNPYDDRQSSRYYGVAFHNLMNYALIVGNRGRVLKYDGQSLTGISSGNIDAELGEVAWKPDGSYALIIGKYNRIIWKFDESGIEELEIPYPIEYGFMDVAWKPDGSYALIVGLSGVVLKYDGGDVVLLISPTVDDLHGVAWHPTDDYAVIVGLFGNILKYNEFTFTHIKGAPSIGLEDIAWNPDGSYAIIVGQNGVVLKYDGLIVTEEESGTSLDLMSIAWRSDGDHALIVGCSFEDNPFDMAVIKYTGDSYILLNETFFGSPISVEWSVDDRLAYILTGSEVITYDGVDFNYIQIISFGILRGMDWKPDGTYALFVGQDGNVLKYAPELPSGIPIIYPSYGGNSGEYNPDEDDDSVYAESTSLSFLYIFFIILAIILILSVLIVIFFRFNRNERIGKN